MSAAGSVHVVHVLHALSVGGTENGLVNLLGRWPAGPIRHTVVSMTTAGTMADRLPGTVERYCIHKAPGRDLGAVRRLLGLLRQLRPDVVHSRNWGAFDAIPAARLARVPVVIHSEHGREATDPDGRDRRRNRLRRLMSPLVTRFATVSLDLRRWLVDVVGIAERRVTTIPNGVDTERFSSGDRRGARRALGVSENRLVVGAIGRLDPVKDYMTLLTAVARLRDAHPNLVVTIVGDGPCRESLEARAGRPDLAGRVRFLGERSDVALLLNGFDVFALPSLAEGMSNTVLEAMATGLPVVATRVGGNPEMVEDGRTGRLVPPVDPIALGAVLASYLNDDALRARHGTTARERAVDRFGLDGMVAAYRDLYVSCAGTRGRVTAGEPA